MLVGQPLLAVSGHQQVSPRLTAPSLKLSRRRAALLRVLTVSVARRPHAEYHEAAVGCSDPS